MLTKALKDISPLNESMMTKAEAHVNQLIKPPKSLGELEKIAIQLAGITGELTPQLNKKTIITLAGDHGVYEEGVTSNLQDITYAQTILMSKGLPGVCAIGQVTNTKIQVVDIGVKKDLPADVNVIARKIKYGTNNIAKGPAMTREEAIQAIEVGIEMADLAINEGAQLLGTGEMGIGNTTPSTAMLAVFGNIDPETITGKGAGTGEGGIQHKIDVIRRAIHINDPNRHDPIDILAKVGGLEIGGMAGVMIGAAKNRVPVVVDGYISTVAALLAVRLEPKIKPYLIASHATEEPGGVFASQLVGIEPVLQMKMCLGEGSGAALMMPIIDAAMSMMKNMPTFEDVGMKL
ncbi:MAG TPA: nicotinate-nucleotide--dimethylbenzimidazole phosphoribosyltransferase [Sporosarcina sp.]|nr:nicotinate-nucleotide--dimethylbenzimidazole phosphoribosyltransferase [Sporosarcina sp.]